MSFAAVSGSGESPVSSALGVVMSPLNRAAERLQETIARALKYKYDVYIKTLTTQFKGIHAVPKEHFDAMKANFIPEKELKKIYPSKDFPQVHFGLMGKGMELVHLKKPHGRK